MDYTKTIRIESESKSANLEQRGAVKVPQNTQSMAPQH